MAMDMDEQLCQQQRRWFLQLQIGEKITLTPTANEPLWVTDVFLVDPESAAGQGVVAACVKMGTRIIMLAQLSSERTDVELQTPVILDEEFCFYVKRLGGDSDADADATVVQLEGFMLPDQPSPDTEEGLKEEEGASSEDDDGTISEDYEEDSESDVEVNVDAARATNAGGNSKDVGKVAARTFLGLFLFSYMVAFIRFFM